MAKFLTGGIRPDPVAELSAWIERLEAALAPLAAGDGSDVASIDHLVRTIRQGWVIYDRLPEDPRGEQLVMLLRRANAALAAAEDVVGRLRLATR
jgi:ParB-like chromosome segregation protein Spo0J